MTNPTPEDGIAYGLCPIKHAPASECATCDNIADALHTAVEAATKPLADEVERLRKESEGYRLMVCRQACKMCFPVPDGERSPFEEIARLRKALEIEVRDRACIHESVRHGFGVQCSRCHAAATLMNLGWHSMINHVPPGDALESPGYADLRADGGLPEARAALEGKDESP